MQIIRFTMKRISALLLASVILCSFACSENKSSEENSTETNTSSDLSSQELQTPADTPSTQTVTVPEAVGSAPIIQQSSPAAPAAATSGGALNPAHGQPGHDCSISVGAPLSTGKNAQGGQMNTTPVNTTPVTASPSSPTPVIATPGQSSPGTTAPGMNPPHGEPGHDCAKPVGAPLK